MIVPAAAAAEVDIHAGPRTIIADGEDQTMVTAIAADAFGNPLPDGEAVVISLVDESGPGRDVTAAVEHGIVARLIASDTSAGSVEVFATADSGVSSRRVGFEEVPGVGVERSGRPHGIPHARCRWTGPGRDLDVGHHRPLRQSASRWPPGSAAIGWPERRRCRHRDHDRRHREVPAARPLPPRHGVDRGDRRRDHRARRPNSPSPQPSPRSRSTSFATTPAGRSSRSVRFSTISAPW